MNLVYIKVDFDLIETLPDFFRKLKRFVGWFRIEAQDVYDIERNRVVISFYTNKIKTIEGESREVYLECRRNDKKSWYFTGIEK